MFALYNTRHDTIDVGDINSKKSKAANLYLLITHLPITI